MRFTQSADSENEVKTSLGLGLHVAREIALAHGGSISADSDGVETTFTERQPRQGPKRSHEKVRIGAQFVNLS